MGAWIGMCLDLVVPAVLIDLRYRAGHWTRIQV